MRSEADRKQMAGAPFELYDVRADPDELTNLASAHPEVVEGLSSVLEDWYAGGSQPPDGAELQPEPLNPQEREMLRSLGYIE